MRIHSSMFKVLDVCASHVYTMSRLVVVVVVVRVIVRVIVKIGECRIRPSQTNTPRDKVGKQTNKTKKKKKKKRKESLFWSIRSVEQMGNENEIVL